MTNPTQPSPSVSKRTPQWRHSGVRERAFRTSVQCPKPNKEMMIDNAEDRQVMTMNHSSYSTVIIAWQSFVVMVLRIRWRWCIPVSRSPCLTPRTIRPQASSHSSAKYSHSAAYCWLDSDLAGYCWLDSDLVNYCWLNETCLLLTRFRLG